MHGSRTNVIALALFLAAGAASPVLAVELNAGLVVSADRGSASVSLDGRTIRTTQARIANPRVIAVEGSAKVVAMWDEVSSRGTEAYYGLSLDGGRTFPLVGPNAHVVRLAYAGFDPLVSGEPTIEPGLRSTGNVYLVQFVIQPLDEFRRDVSAAGGRVERFLTDHTHVVTMDAAAAARVAALPHVRWVGKYHTAYRLSSDIRADLAAGQMDSSAQRYSIECFRVGRAQQDAVAAMVTKLGGVVDLFTDDGYRMEATLTPAQLLAVAAMDEVNYIDPWGGPGGTDMNIIRQLQGATPTLTNLGITGQGVRGEIYDTEVRTSHQAFQNPPVLLHRGSAGNAANAHGSSCYGIVFANWAANPNMNGMCLSGQQGIFCDYTLGSQFGGPVSRLVLNTEAVDPTGQYRSTFQTSSVGNAQTTAYTTLSAETDDYLHRVDYLSLQSQSNTGNVNSRPQAWAKNIVSVGGVNWMGTLTKADDNYNGASIGPASDTRVKPDLTNCFDAIPTTDNASNNSTTTFGGTSGATPITAGAFGLMMQLWHQGAFPGHGGGASVFADRPLSVTAKAIMINTAAKYPLTQGGLTRARQGWGMPAVDNLYNLRNKMLIVNGSDNLRTGESKTYTVTVPAGEPMLAITMSFKDPKGNPAAAQARINDLTLRATAPNGTTVYFGNSGLGTSNTSTAGGNANTVDTVENIFVANPTAGVWTIRVEGTSVVEDANLATPATDANFALVASGIVGPALSISLPTGAPTLVPPSVPTLVPVRIVAASQTLQAGSATLRYRMQDSGGFLAAPLTHVSGDDFLAAIPAPACWQRPEFYITATGSGGTVVTMPGTAPAEVLRANVGIVVNRFIDDFETDKGWSGADLDDTATTGRWTRGIPQATSAQPGEDHTLNGQNCWITDFRAGQQVSDFDVDDGKTTLTSPLFDGTGMDEARIGFWFWYSNGVGPSNPNTNVFEIQITNNDGISWLPVETIGPTGPETTGAWTERSYLISSLAAPTTTMRMRFIARDDTGSIVEAAIDDFQVTGLTCPETRCYANCDNSNIAPVLNVADFACYLNHFSSGHSYANCDGSTVAPVLNVADFVCFLNKFAAGCP